MRLVLDTNVWLDWLVFDDPVVAPLKAAVAQGRAAVFIDDAVEAELTRVLAYPFGSRTLDARAQADALAQCLRVACRAEGGEQRAEGGEQRAEGGGMRDEGALPKCSDPDDQKFLELALACEATALLTRDEALLELGRKKSRPLPFRIVAPQALSSLEA